MIHLYGRATIIGRMRYFFLDRNYNHTVRISLILLCLIATLVTTFLFRGIDTGASVIPGLIPMLAIGGIAGLAVVYTNMEVFSVVVLVVTMLVNDGISTGSGTKATFTFVLLYVWFFIWLFKMIVIERKFDIRPSPANLPILLFSIAVIISLLWSSAYPEPSVQYLLDSKLAPRLMTALVMIISPVTFIFYANHVRSLNTLRFITWWFIGVGFIYMAIRIGLGSIPNPLNAKGQFPTWVGIIALGQMLFNPELKRWLRIVLGVTIVGWFYITMTLGVSWLSGWLPLLVGFMAVLFFYSRKLLFVVLIMGMGYYIFSYSAIQENFAREGEESGGTRSQAWERVFNLTGRHFLFGTGPAGYHFYFTVNISGLFQLSHNNYIDIIAQTGVTGFALWLLLWGAIGLATWRMYRLIPYMGGGFQKGLAISLIASYFCTLVAMALGDWVTPFPYTQTLQGIDYTIWAWMLPGLATALYYITKERMENEAVQEITIQELSLGDSITRVPLLPRPSQPSTGQ
ncbi:MAG: O-antigen ligase family protein [Anaerolineae bacterium]|nr:O-antigen ligase family protein [Anaerolineae bacterium]